MVESLLREYPNVLTLRVRMPIVPDLTYPRNFITKIIKYDKVIDIPNSMTVLPELLPMAIEMAKRKLTGEPSFSSLSQSVRLVPRTSLGCAMCADSARPVQVLLVLPVMPACVYCL